MLIESVGSKRELRAVLKELDVSLQEVLEANVKYAGALQEESEQKKSEEYGNEVSEEHRLAVERVETHLRDRSGEPPSGVTTRSSTESRASARHASRMAEVEGKVRELELQQLQHRLKKEEEEQKLHRERLLQEKQDALKAAKLKTSLTQAAETDLTWERRDDFTDDEEEGTRRDVNQEPAKDARPKPAKEARPEQAKEARPEPAEPCGAQPEPASEPAAQRFRQILPRLKLPTFSGCAEEWPRWYSLFSTLVRNQQMSAHEKITYLQNAVTGAARATIGGMVCDGNSYEDALQALRDRYGRDLDVDQEVLG